MSRKKKAPPPASAPRSTNLRTWMVLWALGLVAALVVVWWTRGPSRPVFVTTPDQNILIVTIDTLRGDALGTYGGQASTPNIDRVAREGVRFDFAHAHAVITLPSHTSIMTGRNPFEHGVRDNAGYRLADSETTLAEMAKAKGFATGAFVGAFPLDRQFGLAQGFDIYDDLSAREATTSDFAFSERTAGEVVASAQQWITAQQKPWFAWVHVFDPHAPYAPPAPYAQQYSNALYAGEVAYTDHALGPLFELARSSTRPTTVVITADHGEGLGEHGELTHGVFAYETTLRVPLILAQLKAGGTPAQQPFASAAAVRHIDVVPTLAMLTGLETSGQLPGRSLIAALDEDGAEEPPTYFEAMTAMLVRGWAPLRGVIVGREKYVDLPIEELYDLAADPDETRNLVASSTDRTRALAGRLKSLGAALPGEQVDENAEVRARLQSLGYVSGSAPRKAQYTEEDDPKRLIDVDHWMMQGIELHRAGRSREAMDAYRQVIARRPDMALAYRRLAYIQWDVGAAADAIATLQDATAKLGPDVETDIRLGTYLAETGNAAAALPLLQRATAAAPDNTEAMNALGIAYARGGRPADALATFEKILEADPRDAHALENIGTVHLQQGDLDAASAAFRRVLAEGPGTSRAFAGLGVVATRQGRQAEAIEHWRRAVELDRRNFDALFNLASTLARIDPARARPYAQQFVQTAPPGFYGREIAEFRAWLGGGAP